MEAVSFLNLFYPNQISFFLLHGRKREVDSVRFFPSVSFLFSGYVSEVIVWDSFTGVSSEYFYDVFRQKVKF